MGLSNGTEVRTELDKILNAPMGEGLENADPETWGTSVEAQEEMSAFMALGEEL